LASLGFIAVGGALSVVSGLIALAVSFAAYRYLKIGEVGLLTYLSLSFALLGVGLMLQGAMSLILGLRLGNVYEDARLTDFMGITYLMVENLAYLLLAITFIPALSASRTLGLSCILSLGEGGMSLLSCRLRSNMAARTS